MERVGNHSKSKMRVLQVVHRYRPANGGVEQHVAELGEGLVERGHSVDVATTRAASISTYHSALARHESINGVDVYRYDCIPRGRLTRHILRFGHDHYQTMKKWWLEPFVVVGKGPISPGMAWHILRRRWDYDLVHIQALPFFHPIYTYISARLAGLPVVITPHIHVDQPEDFDLSVYSRILRQADLVLVQSEREIPYLLQRGVKPERIAQGGCGVRLSDFPIRPPHECRARLGLPLDAFILLFLGRKESYKGLRTLVTAFAELQTQHRSLYLVSAGQNTDDSQRLRRDFEGLERWLDLESISEVQKVDLLNSCNALVLPSTGEAFGIVFLEGWAVRKPVIGVRSGAIPWVIEDGKDGLLARSNDPADLARAIERLVLSPRLATELASVGYDKVTQRFTVDQVTDRIEQAYRRLYNDARVPKCV